MDAVGDTQVECLLYQLAQPLFVALCELVEGRLASATVLFCLSSDGRRGLYLEKDGVARPIFGLAELPVIPLYYRHSDELVRVGLGAEPFCYSLQSLLEFHQTLPPDTLQRLHLQPPHPLLPHIVELDTHIKQLQAKAKIWRAVLQCGVQSAPRRCPVEDDSAACRKVYSRLLELGWQVWAGTEQQRGLLYDQYKLCKGRVDFREYCLQNVASLAALVEELDFRPNFHIVHKPTGQRVSIYYSEAGDRLESIMQ